MKPLFFALILSSLALIGSAQDLVILHTNDIHSHLNGLSPESEYTPMVNDNDPTSGGLARVAGFIDQQKSENGDKVLVLDGGDYLMGTLFQTIEPTDGFQLGLMKKAGYDFLGVGNHEFDFGTAGLAQIINRSKKNGPIPQVLFLNFKPQPDGRDSTFMHLFDDKTIQPYSIIEKNGYKIGIFGLLGIDAQEAIPSYQHVLTFDPIEMAKKTARYLKQEQQVDLVIVLSHSGVFKNKKGEWIGEDIDLGKKVPEIDLIISAHKHPYLVSSIKAGNATIVKTDALGCYMGRVEVRFDANKKPQFSSEMIRMDDQIPANAEIQELIDNKGLQIERNLLSPFNVTYKQPVVETAFDVVYNENQPLSSNMGPLVADAIYYYLNKNQPEPIDVAFIASGVIRTSFEKGNTGMQNIGDIFNVTPLGMGDDLTPGTPLGRLYITAREIKKVLELILVVYPSKLDYFLHGSGIRLTIEPHRGLFRKIRTMEFLQKDGSYAEASFSKKEQRLYCLAANKYMLGFISNLKKMSKGLVVVIPRDRNGQPITAEQCMIDMDPTLPGILEGKEWLAILDYVRSFPDTNHNGVPDLPEEYRNKRNPYIFK